MHGEQMKYSFFLLIPVIFPAQSMHLDSHNPNIHQGCKNVVKKISHVTAQHNLANDTEQNALDDRIDYRSKLEKELSQITEEEAINRYQSLIRRTKAWEYAEVAAKVLSDISQITSLALYMSQSNDDCESNKILITFAGYCGVASFGFAKFAGITKKFQVENKEKINMILKKYGPSMKPLHISNVSSETHEET